MSAKGKGKAVSTQGASSSSASTSASTSNATASTSTLAAARRAPVGKVIHYFADSPSQGYDGAKFADAYQKHVLRLNEEQELAATKQTVEDQKRAERLKEVEDEDIEMLMQQTGLTKESVQDLFVLAGSSKLEDACRAYLQPESYAQKQPALANGVAQNGDHVAVEA